MHFRTSGVYVFVSYTLGIDGAKQILHNFVVSSFLPFITGNL
ncbi:hypothetical protein MY1_0395 [Nitrosarchaeum koreense MY1]|uniref:Uncharacterized protein n=1 Tax=Nitrosarchaeum koreense MY1 TaxID=1001994 RepID=F9CV50_9ARCH|nr:hypothetical protein MY1_0395 [Nitrosarchaeum koreense MY1]